MIKFRIQELIEIYLNGKDAVKYEEYNSVVGVLESVKLEFYRRAVAAYEDNKIVENGDISLYTVTMSKKLVLSISGGMDSVVLLHMAVDKGYDEINLITFNYGQRHIRET